MTLTAERPRIAEPQPQSARAKVRAWVRAAMRGKTEISAPDLTNEIVDRLIDDRDSLREFIRDGIHQEVLLVLASSRDFTLLGEVAVTAEGMDQRAEKLQGRWAAWLEHVGDRHIRLPKMTSEELFIAADERESRAESELEIARLWRAMAKQMEPGQTVGERFTADEIDHLRASLKKRGR